MRQTLACLPEYAATSLMFKLSSLFEFQLRKLVGPRKFRPILQFGDFRSIENTTHLALSI